MNDQGRPIDDERGSEEQPVQDPAGRRVPFVGGPTGAAPLGSELRGDPSLEDDRNAENGAMGGAIAGTGVAGPVGGIVGAVLGGAAGATLEEDEDEGTAEEEEERM